MSRIDSPAPEAITVRRISQDELAAWHSRLLAQSTRGPVVPDPLTVIMQFGGDRLSCCTLGACVADGPDGEFRAVASMAPDGEQGCGTPTIVGWWYADDAAGLAAFHAALMHLAASREGDVRVRFDATTREEHALALRSEGQAHLEVRDFCWR